MSGFGCIEFEKFDELLMISAGCCLAVNLSLLDFNPLTSKIVKQINGLKQLGIKLINSKIAFFIVFYWILNKMNFRNFLKLTKTNNEDEYSSESVKFKGKSY